MDILAARKKAAERVKTRKKPEPPQRTDSRSVQAEKQPLPVELVTTLPATVAESTVAEAPVPESAAPLVHEPAGTATASSGEETGAEEVQELELLSFRLGGEEYAVMVEDVREVLRVFHLTTVPNTPGYILGVMSLRGAMLPVIDLCKRLGLASGVRDEKSRLIVVDAGDEDVGLIVDRVTGVLRFLPEAIKPTPENIEQGAEYLRGIARKDDKLYILLDLQKAVWD